MTVRPADALGEAKCKTFAEVIRVSNTGQTAKGHPIPNVLLKVNPPKDAGWQVERPLFATSFAPYESGEVAEVVYNYIDPPNRTREATFLDISPWW